MEKKWNWDVFWTAVSAVATSFAMGVGVYAVFVAVQMGNTANEVAKQGREIAESALKVSQNSFEAMEDFNEMQKRVMDANIAKMKYDLLNSEKFLYCEKILSEFCFEYYVMSDKSTVELVNMFSIPFHHCQFDDNDFCQRYGIEDRDEMIVFKDFIMRCCNGEWKKFGISSIGDAYVYYFETMNVFGAMLFELGYDEKRIEQDQGWFILRTNKWFIECMHYLAQSADECEGIRNSFPTYFKHVEQIHEQMIEVRNEKRNDVKKTVKRLKNAPDSQNALYWNAYLNFINKNDKLGKKAPYPAVEKKKDDSPAAGKKGKPADKPAVKAGRKAETKRGK